MNTKFDFAPGSGPDIAARLRHAVEANETTRILLTDSLSSLAKVIDLHLEHIDAHLERLIADLEGRTE